MCINHPDRPWQIPQPILVPACPARSLSPTPCVPRLRLNPSTPYVTEIGPKELTCLLCHYTRKRWNSASSIIISLFGSGLCLCVNFVSIGGIPQLRNSRAYRFIKNHISVTPMFPVSAITGGKYASSICIWSWTVLNSDCQRGLARSGKKQGCKNKCIDGQLINNILQSEAS